MALDAYQPNAFLQLVVPDNYSASGEGSGVDVRTYHGRAAAILNQKAGTGTTPTLNVKLQESADDSTYTDISGATFTQATSANGTEAIEVDLDGVSRYVRAKYVLAGTTPAFDLGVTLVAPKQYQ